MVQAKCYIFDHVECWLKLMLSVFEQVKVFTYESFGLIGYNYLKVNEISDRDTVQLQSTVYTWNTIFQVVAGIPLSIRSFLIIGTTYTGTDRSRSQCLLIPVLKTAATGYIAIYSVSHEQFSKAVFSCDTLSYIIYTNRYYITITH
jgi:hypothetical protein